MGQENPREFSRMTVLVVDDVSKTRSLIRQMLIKIGFERILQADGGDTAWKLLLVERVHLILCDINMARMNGFQLLAGVRKSAKLNDVPVIMVSSSHDREDIIRCVREGANAYVVKPFSVETLRAKIEESFRPRKDSRQIEAEEIFLRAEKLREEGDLDSAIRAFEAALQIFPNAETHFHLGDLYHGQGDIDKAIAHFSQAIALDRELRKAYERLAELYCEKGDPGKAIIVMKKSLQVQPDNGRSLAYLGELLLAQNRLREARETFSRALAVDPADPTLKTRIGDAYLKNEKYADAETSFLGALSDDPRERTYVLNRLAIALRKQGKYDQAIEQYRKAISLDPRDEILHYNAARAYWESGQRTDALSSLHQALDLQPHFPEAREFLDRIRRG